VLDLTAIQDRLLDDEYGDASRDVDMLIGEDIRLRSTLETCKGGLPRLRDLVRQGAPPDVVLAVLDGVIGSVDVAGI